MRHKPISDVEAKYKARLMDSNQKYGTGTKASSGSQVGYKLRIDFLRLLGIVWSISYFALPMLKIFRVPLVVDWSWY